MFYTESRFIQNYFFIQKHFPWSCGGRCQPLLQSVSWQNADEDSCVKREKSAKTTKTESEGVVKSWKKREVGRGPPPKAAPAPPRAFQDVGPVPRTHMHRRSHVLEDGVSGLRAAHGPKLHKLASTGTENVICGRIGHWEAGCHAKTTTFCSECTLGCQ